MHLFASGAHRMYGTCLFFCVIYHLTNSYVHSYPAKTGDNEDSVQIEKLRLISKRLTHLRRHPFVDEVTLSAEALSLIKSLTTSTGTAHLTAHKRDETDDPFEIMNPDRRQTRLEVLKRVYRQTGDPLGNFKRVYADLINALVPFLQTVVQNIKPGTNSILSDITLIPSLLPLNDQAFSNGNIDSVLYKYNFLEQSTRAVLVYMNDYILDAYKQWFTDQSKIIDHKLSTATFATFSLPFHGDFSEVSVMSCGASCINTGVQAGIKYNTMVMIIDLVKLLVYKNVGTTPT